MTKDVIFGEGGDEEEKDQQGLDDEEFVGMDEEEDNQVEEKDMEDNSQEDSSDNEDGKPDREEIEERSSWKLETLGACHGGNISIMVRREHEEKGVSEDWLHFDSELSEHSKDEMKNKVESLQQNKDAWDGPIKLKLINKGTMDDPQVRFIDYEIPDSSDVPDGFEVVEDPDSDSGSSSNSDSGDEIKLSDYKFDEAMEKLEDYSNGNYSVETEIVKIGVTGNEPNIVKAEVQIHDGDGEGRYTGHATDEDSTMKSQLLEVAETRAVKRAIKNSGVLVN